MIGNQSHLDLFRAVIPYVIDDDNATTLDFQDSYVTTREIYTTDDYAVVYLFGRDCVDVECPKST